MVLKKNFAFSGLIIIAFLFAVSMFYLELKSVTQQDVAFIQVEKKVISFESGEIVIIDVQARQVIKKVRIGHELHNSVMVQIG